MPSIRLPRPHDPNWFVRRGAVRGRCPHAAGIRHSPLVKCVTPWTTPRGGFAPPDDAACLPGRSVKMSEVDAMPSWRASTRFLRFCLSFAIAAAATLWLGSAFTGLGWHQTALVVNPSLFPAALPCPLPARLHQVSALYVPDYHRPHLHPRRALWAIPYQPCCQGRRGRYPGDDGFAGWVRADPIDSCAPRGGIIISPHCCGRSQPPPFPVSNLLLVPDAKRASPTRRLRQPLPLTLP